MMLIRTALITSIVAVALTGLIWHIYSSAAVSKEPSGHVEFSITGLDDRKTYYIAVTAFDNENPKNESAFSNEVNGRPRGGKIRLQWDANTEADLAGYNIYYDNENSRYNAGKVMNPYTGQEAAEGDSPIELRINMGPNGGGGGGCFIANASDC